MTKLLIASAALALAACSTAPDPQSPKVKVSPLGSHDGEFCPLEDASNPIAWEKNRRVEFKVVKTEDALTGVKRGCARATEKGVTPPVVK